MGGGGAGQGGMWRSGGEDTAASVSSHDLPVEGPTPAPPHKTRSVLLQGVGDDELHDKPSVTRTIM